MLNALMGRSFPPFAPVKELANTDPVCDDCGATLDMDDRCPECGPCDCGSGFSSASCPCSADFGDWRDQPDA